MSKANLAESSLLERALRAEKIQLDNYNNKKPLQRAIQLIKRYRDIYFEKDDSYKTSSIILTTIAGQFYKGEESIFETIDNINSRIRVELQFSQRLKILNPVNSQEDFTDKWDSEPEYYEAFKKFVIHLNNEWQKLKEHNGVIKEAKIFKGLFGGSLVERVQLRLSNKVTETRNKGSLGMHRDTGIISSSLSSKNQPVKKNTFFGG